MTCGHNCERYRAAIEYIVTYPLSFHSSVIVSIQAQRTWPHVDWRRVDVTQCIAPKATRIATTTWSK